MNGYLRQTAGSGVPETPDSGAAIAQDDHVSGQHGGAESLAGNTATCMQTQDPDLWLYRERTVALLKRYLKFSIEVGRLPSLLGRELFRAKITAYRMASFEDAVIFVHDVERILEQLDGFSKDLIAVIIFEDYSQDEAAEVLQCARRTVCREFPETIDRLSERFLESGLLNRLPAKRTVENFCQGGQNGEFPATACKHAE
jgi:hypothetical protein